MAAETPLRDAEDWWKFAFMVTAEKDGDIAYVGSDWNEGIQPWDFDVPFNLNEASPLLRGTVFTDRGVYRLGEEVTFKAVLRAERRGRHPAAAGRAPPIFVSVRDGQDRVVDERTVKVNTWSSAEWTMTLPADGTLGNYSRARDARERQAEAADARAAAARARRPGREPTTTCRTTRSSTGRSWSPPTVVRISASTSR